MTAHAILLFLILVFAALAVLFGWGGVLVRILGMSGTDAPLVMAAGMAALLFLGGVLNLARLVSPRCIDVLVLAGLAAAAASAWHGRRRAWPWSHAAPALALGVVVLFVGGHLMPQKIFNLRDDLQRYFSYPVRMLETGTLVGNPLGCAGFDTLGGQAFLQAFVVRYLPIGHIGTLEWGIGLPLCLALAAFCRTNGRAAITTAAALLAIVALDPRTVNVTSVFTTSALTLAACLLGRLTLEAEAGFPPFLLLGLVYAGLVALKNTNAVIVLAHFGLLVGLGAGPGRLGARAIGRWIATAASTLVALVPWILAHLSTYVAVAGARRQPEPAGRIAFEPLATFLYPAGTRYGAAPLLSTLAALGALALSGWSLAAVVKKKRPASPDTLSGLAAGFAAALGYTLVIVLGRPAVGELTSIRYGSPFLIGAIPACIILLGGVRTQPREKHPRAAEVCLGLGLFFVFFPSMRQRIRQIADHGSPLAFLAGLPAPAVESYAASSRETLGGKTRSIHQRIQALVPAGEPVAVWSLSPFWLNYARNPIYDTDAKGLALWGMKFPPARYLLVQYGGAARMDGHQLVAEMHGAPGSADRLSAEAALEFGRRLELYAKDSEVMYNDGEYALMRLRR